MRHLVEKRVLEKLLRAILIGRLLIGIAKARIVQLFTGRR